MAPTVQLLADLCGALVPVDTVSVMIGKTWARLTPKAERIVEAVVQADVTGADESGCRVASKLSLPKNF